jgi:transposase
MRLAKKAKSEGEKKSVGRPKKSEQAPKADDVSAAKGAKYPLLKNPENLTSGQEAVVEMIAKRTPALYRAYLLKEKLRLVFRLPLSQATVELNAWIKWAQHCRIPQYVALQRKIRRHYDAIVSTIKYGLSNARIESMNNKIKLTVRMGYGYRNIDNLIALVMLRCQKLDPKLFRRA